MNKVINRIYLRDNMDFLKTLPDNSIDSVITDPYFETMNIGNSKATKQDKESNFIH